MLKCRLGLNCRDDCIEHPLQTLEVSVLGHTGWRLRQRSPSPVLQRAAVQGGHYFGHFGHRQALPVGSIGLVEGEYSGRLAQLPARGCMMAIASAFQILLGHVDVGSGTKRTMFERLDVGVRIVGRLRLLRLFRRHDGRADEDEENGADRDTGRVASKDMGGWEKKQDRIDSPYI